MTTRKAEILAVIAWIITILMALFARRAFGQTVNDPTKAAQNTAWLQKQMNSGNTVSLPIGTLYIDKRVTSPVRIGGRITTKGMGVGYWYPGDHPSGMANRLSRICQLTKGEPIFVLRGAGVICYSPLVLEGQGDAAAIEIEGRAGPVATGRHRFSNLSFYNWQAAFKALGGYYGDDGKFVADENHADNSSVTDCEYMNCERIFWSQNQQAVNWYFRGSLLGWTGGTPKPVVAFDCERGGKVHVDGIEFCTNRVTLFRVRDFSPNTAWLTCRDLTFDRQPYPDTYLTLFDYAGDPAAAAWSKWVLDLDGFVCQKLPADKLFRVPANLPRDKWRVNLQTIYE